MATLTKQDIQAYDARCSRYEPDVPIVEALLQARDVEALRPYAQKYFDSNCCGYCLCIYCQARRAIENDEWPPLPAPPLPMDGGVNMARPFPVFPPRD